MVERDLSTHPFFEPYIKFTGSLNRVKSVTINSLYSLMRLCQYQVLLTQSLRIHYLQEKGTEYDI